MRTRAPIPIGGYAPARPSPRTGRPPRQGSGERGIMESQNYADVSAPEAKGKATRARRPRGAKPPSDTSKRSLNLRVDDETYERLHVHALRRRQTVSELVMELARANLREFYKSPRRSPGVTRSPLPRPERPPTASTRPHSSTDPEGPGRTSCRDGTACRDPRPRDRARPASAGAPARLTAAAAARRYLQRREAARAHACPPTPGGAAEYGRSRPSRYQRARGQRPCR